MIAADGWERVGRMTQAAKRGAISRQPSTADD